MKKGFKEKTDLEFHEKVSCVWAHFIKGVDQHTLAGMYGVNSGRVADAITAAKEAFGHEDTLYKVEE